MRDFDKTLELGWDKESQERRAYNRENSAQILADRGVQFETKNLGVHLVVKHGGKVVDFWPGTGKYIPRGEGKPGRGVFNLLRLLKVAP